MIEDDLEYLEKKFANSSQGYAEAVLRVCARVRAIPDVRAICTKEYPDTHALSDPRNRLRRIAEMLDAK